VLSKKINISEIAMQLGVSKSTVSKALNDSHEISASTKLKIQKFATKHHYRPNKLAVNLKSGQTKTIGVVVPSIQNFFFARVLREIKKENGHIIDVIQNDKPVVLFDRVTKKLICNQVVGDDLEANYMATKHLISLNCKNIALASTIDYLSVGKQRKKGYKKALKEAGLPVNDSHIINANLNNLDVKIVHLLQQKDVDAILALDEDAVFAAYRAAKYVGIKMPEDLAIIGYISDKMAKNLIPRLSTLNQHGIELGSKATELLIGRLQKKHKEPFQKIKINTTLTERESTNGYIPKIISTK